MIYIFLKVFYVSRKNYIASGSEILLYWIKTLFFCVMGKIYIDFEYSPNDNTILHKEDNL